jgi:hypothetical protein
MPAASVGPKAPVGPMPPVGPMALVGGDCATCHRTIDRDWRPPSHGANWTRGHGASYLAKGEATTDRCSLCHAESSCSSCHEDSPPESHTNHFRGRGHGFLASLDRDRCSTCHQTDSCDRCHRETEPKSHFAASWGGTTSKHCLVCHFPLQAENCSVCHEDAASHALAPPKPPDHSPGMNCLQCHGLTAPLPHATKGDDCNACHL